jgi:hypothetical protein
MRIQVLNSIKRCLHQNQHGRVLLDESLESAKPFDCLMRIYLGRARGQLHLHTRVLPGAIDPRLHSADAKVKRKCCVYCVISSRERG